ncbi:MAG: hypothetical protein WBP93_16120 [Pyrinomonadaceae bacterium]
MNIYLANAVYPKHNITEQAFALAREQQYLRLPLLEVVNAMIATGQISE